MSSELAAKSVKGIERKLQRAALRKFKDQPAEQAQFVRETVARIQSTTNLAASVSAADLVIEAIIETIAAKHELFAKIDAVSCNLPVTTVHFIHIFSTPPI